MFYTYAIKSEVDGRIYVGMTGNVNSRLHQHNCGKTISTRPYRPWSLIHVEEFETRIEARAREVYLKSGIGKEFLKSIYKRPCDTRLDNTK